MTKNFKVDSKELYQKSEKNFFVNQITQKLESKKIKIEWRLAENNETLLISLHLCARPGSKQSKILRLESGELKVWVRAQAVEGMANCEICELIAGKLGVSKSQVEITRGEGIKKKVLTVRYSIAKRGDLQYYLQKISELVVSDT